MTKREPERDTIKLRGKTYGLRWRVPARYSGVEKRQRVYVSLKTADPVEARLRAPAAKADLIDAWERALGRQVEETVAGRFARLVELAGSLGHRHKTIAEIAEGPVDDLVARVETLAKLPQPSPDTIAAVLGGVENPKFMVSNLPALYEKHTILEHQDKNERQMHLWRLPRLRAVANWIEAIGDKLIHEITRSDVIDFRAWQVERVLEDGIQPSSANKDFTHLAGMLTAILDAHKLTNTAPFAGLYLKVGDAADRVPFESEWIVKHLLNPGGLPGLGSQAKDILIIMQGTGCRPSEIIGLLPPDIHLDSNIPHFEITKRGKAVKTKASLRLVPLTGAALEAMRRNPDGFPKYRGKPTNWSNAVNKYLREAKPESLLLDRQSAYSLRHSFADRLTNQGKVEGRQYWDMMGQTPQGEKYGKGANLETKLEITLRVDLSSQGRS